MKSPALLGAEGDRRAGALAGDARRFGVLIGKDDVVLGALAIDQRELHDLPSAAVSTGLTLPSIAPPTPI